MDICGMADLYFLSPASSTHMAIARFVPFSVHFYVIPMDWSFSVSEQTKYPGRIRSLLVMTPLRKKITSFLLLRPLPF